MIIGPGGRTAGHQGPRGLTSAGQDGFARPCPACFPQGECAASPATAAVPAPSDRMPEVARRWLVTSAGRGRIHTERYRSRDARRTVRTIAHTLNHVWTRRQTADAQHQQVPASGRRDGLPVHQQVDSLLGIPVCHGPSHVVPRVSDFPRPLRLRDGVAKAIRLRTGSNAGGGKGCSTAVNHDLDEGSRGCGGCCRGGSGRYRQSANHERAKLPVETRRPVHSFLLFPPPTSPVSEPGSLTGSRDGPALQVPRPPIRRRSDSREITETGRLERRAPGSDASLSRRAYNCVQTHGRDGDCPPSGREFSGTSRCSRGTARRAGARVPHEIATDRSSRVSADSSGISVSEASSRSSKPDPSPSDWSRGSSSG